MSTNLDIIGWDRSLIGQRGLAHNSKVIPHPSFQQEESWGNGVVLTTTGSGKGLVDAVCAAVKSTTAADGLSILGGKPDEAGGGITAPGRWCVACLGASRCSG